MSIPTPGISGDQIKDHAVERHDLNTTVPGQAVVERLIAGPGITLSSTGADTGTGDVTISAAGGAGTGGGGTGGGVDPATASSFGTVETDITESGGSVVYSKTTMDSLLAGKISVGAAITESEITGLLMDLGNKVTAGTPLPESEITNLVSDLAGKIAAGTALPESEISGLVSDLAGKMASGAVLPESEISGLAADLAARLVVAGTAAVGQVPTVTSTSPLMVQWQTPGGAPAAGRPAVLEIFIPGPLAAGADIQEVLLPSFFSTRPLTGVSARAPGGGSTSGSIQFRLELCTGTGGFAAAQTSDTFTLAQGAGQLAPVTTFTNGLTGSAEQVLRAYIVSAGTNVMNFVIKAEF